MTSFDTHPKTGRHYAIVLSPNGAYRDLWAMYAHAAKTRPWLEVMTRQGADVLRATSLYQDPRLVMVVWEPTKFVPFSRDERRAKVIGVYSEALGGDMLEAHIEHFEQFASVVPDYDAIAVHAPRAKQILEKVLVNTPVVTLPVGWCPFAMGVPDFIGPRPRELVFVGSNVGRRMELLPMLQAGLPGLEWPQGLYGQDVLFVLSQARGYLYIAHSKVETFSTWRLWQALSAGTTLFAELADDAWPFVKNEHFVALSSPPTPEEIRERLAEDVSVYAKRAHEAFALDFVIDNVIDEYVVPLGED